MTEVVVALATGEIVEWTAHPGMRPALLFDDSYRAILALRDHPEWQEAMRLRGITDFEKVQIDPWPTGNFGNPLEDDRRIARCLSYYREEPSDNGYARPVEGVLATVDAARGEVLEVLDFGVVPLPPDKGSYLPEDNEPAADRPPSPGHRPVRRAQLHPGRQSADLAALDHAGGHGTAGGPGAAQHRLPRRRSCEPSSTGPPSARWSSPTAIPGPMHGWKNAFDVGEWGLGRMANSLTLGCDCLGEITYLDAVFASEHGKPYVVENAVCIHEEDYGILWKHNDMNTGHEPRSAGRAAWWCPPSPPSATTSTASTGTSISTAPSSSKSS